MKTVYCPDCGKFVPNKRQVQNFQGIDYYKCSYCEQLFRVVTEAEDLHLARVLAQRQQEGRRHFAQLKSRGY